eukprot:CAMPEP_0194038048 /NCGR_PEP_ID=MMETSP0009_2-20130614/10317_1 /TAXON_ID=210454 /ORGANISM="Grammatophora oceanica, Strain CCMP 410" /LENGTH=311 /DNA_ID=CAMNT_0038680419 /DNA_START=23 /DNA_END=958 /DNA_ORIENTATION=+
MDSQSKDIGAALRNPLSSRGGWGGFDLDSLRHQKRQRVGDDSGGDDDDGGSSWPLRWFGAPSLASAITSPSWTGALRTMLGVTLALYILNQKHMLPKPLSGIVSKVLFWPTLPITVSRRIGEWSTVVDDTVIVGGAPFGFAGIPEKLQKEFGVAGVINMCDEYEGPTKTYKRLGMTQLRLKTVDHFEPSVSDLKTAVGFIRKHQARGEKVYVHCRAGHGRSAAVTFAWLLYCDPVVDAKELNEEFCKMRNVRKVLWKQPNIRAFHTWLRTGGVLGKDDPVEQTPSSITSVLNNYREDEEDSDEQPEGDNDL